MLDYAWEHHKIPMVAAHISCCNYPNPRDIVSTYQDNLGPLVKMLELIYQGVWGIVTDGNNRPLKNVTVDLNGQIMKTDKDGKFITIFPVGKYRLEFILDNYETKISEVEVKKNEMKRRDMVLESSVKSVLTYHTTDQIKESLKSLVTQYPTTAQMYTHSNKLECVRITQDLDDDMYDKPSIRVVGWSPVGNEIALNLAQFLITRNGRDDIVSDLTSRYQIHIGFGSDFSTNNLTSLSSCPRQSFHFESNLLEAVKGWDSQMHFLFGLNFFSGSNDVLYSPRVPDPLKYLAGIYSSHSNSASLPVQCEDNHAGKIEKFSSGGRPEISVGLSCCGAPSGLGSLWDSHKKAIVDTLASLQGLHGHVLDENGHLIDYSTVLLSINTSADAFQAKRGHFWRLLPSGKQVLDIAGENFTPVTKLVSVVKGNMTLVEVHLTSLPGLPKLVAVCLLGLLLLSLFGVCWLFRKSKGRDISIHKSNKGFQKLNNKEDMYSDSEEEEIEFVKNMEKIGIKGGTFKDYRDASSTSEEEDLLLTRP